MPTRLLMLLLIAGLTLPPGPAPAASSAALGRPAPAFTLADDRGVRHSLAQFCGRPVALLFFCGCPDCTRTAALWAQLQRGSTLPGRAATLVVFSGDNRAARAFADQTNLDLTHTVLLPDPTQRVSQGTYAAEPCPRVFIIDAAGRVRYTNRHTGTSPDALSVVSYALSTLRACTVSPKLSGAAVPLRNNPPIAALPAMTLGGAPFDLTARHGWKVVYFWSAECPCVRACERYSFLPLAQKYRGRVAFYAVAASRFDLDQPPAKFAQSVQAHSLPFPVLRDPSHRIASALGARVTPQTFLLDPQNRVVFSGMPDDSRRYLGNPKRGVAQTYLARALAEALAGQPITQPKTENQGCIIAW